MVVMVVVVVMVVGLVGVADLRFYVPCPPSSAASLALHLIFQRRQVSKITRKSTDALILYQENVSPTDYHLLSLNTTANN